MALCVQRGGAERWGKARRGLVSLRGEERKERGGEER